MRFAGWLVIMLTLAPLALAAPPVTSPGQAAPSGSGQPVHAFLDRSHVSLGDTVTLNIETNGSLGSPNLTPLRKDFQVLGTSTSSSVRVVNGKATRGAHLGIALKPRHAGTLTIPPLDVGSSATPALTLQVGAAPSGGGGQVGDPVFMRTSVLSSAPYVDAQTVYTVRLFYLPGVDGALGDPSANGARLVRLDRDHRYTVDRDGYTYEVIERSWALIPQRTGAITVDGPEFQGQRMRTGNPNTLFGNPNALLNGQIPGLSALRTTAPSVQVDARAAPANAGKPWLPARDVKLKLSGLPPNGKVDATAPLTLTLAVSASGQPADALPEPELPPIAGARVYPDRTRDATDDTGQWLQGSRTRSFAIVPDRNGTLSIPAIALHWFDVGKDRAEQATVPAHTLHVAGVVATPPSAAAPPAARSAATPASSSVAPAPQAPAQPAAASAFWRILAIASLALWAVAVVVAVVVWARRRRPVHAPTTPPGDDTERGDVAARAHRREVAPADAVAAKTDRRRLERAALDAARTADTVACEHGLLAWAQATHPKITNVGALRGALSDAAQRDALEQLQRARWQHGDAAAACSAILHAFEGGFAWQEEDRVDRTRNADPLPPLYPT